MEAPYRGGNHDAVAEFVEKGMDGAEPGAVAGHDQVELEVPHVADGFGDALLHAGAGEMEAAHDRVERHPPEDVALHA